MPAVDVFVSGLQVPLIPLVDADGSAGAVLFWQSGPACVNSGAIWLVITISMVTGAAHWPAVGVKVYVPLAVVLITAGLQVPVILLFDVVGNAGAVLFRHNGPIWVKVGVIWLAMTISMETGPAH